MKVKYLTPKLSGKDFAVAVPSLRIYASNNDRKRFPPESSVSARPRTLGGWTWRMPLPLCLDARPQAVRHTEL